MRKNWNGLCENGFLPQFSYFFFIDLKLTLVCLPGTQSCMNTRPCSITVIAWIFIIVGAASLFSHSLTAFNQSTPPSFSELGPALGLAILGFVGGVFLLRGKNWARWLLIFWMATHVGISLMHSWKEVLVHAVFLVVLACFLFSPKASAYFRNASPDAPPAP